jgi:hypothetical protein
MEDKVKSWSAGDDMSDTILKSVKSKILANLANNYTPDWEQKFRMATCAACGRRMIRMFHCWLHQAGWMKEVHLCKHCWKHYAE